MAWIKSHNDWQLPENDITPETIYENRREFLKTLASVGWSVAAFSILPPALGWTRAFAAALDNKLGEKGNSLVVTPEAVGSRFNNFYEFGVEKDRLWKLAENLHSDEWTIEIAGLVKKPRVLDAHALIDKMPKEERIYRLRCVEAWSVVLPWTGFPLRKLIQLAEPLSTARYVKFTTFLDPNIARGQKTRFWEPWPYTDGLSLKEAMHDLSFLATGIYGHSLPPHHGAPIRLVVPWKYGFKSIKSIVRIEFTKEEPETFWQNMAPLEYDFSANVDPTKPYARWHQAFERIPGKEGIVITQPYNGYADQVAQLYS